MVEDNQNLDNFENKEEVINKPPKSQKKLIIILLILVVVLLGGVMYFLIKDEIIQIPFLNTEQGNLEIIEEENTKEEATEDEETEDISEDDSGDSGMENNSEEDETEDFDTSDWLTYELDNPKVSFKYPSGQTVREYPNEEGSYLHLAVSGARESFNYYMFYSEAGGPGVGTSGEIEPPESITMIGQFLGEDVYEIKNGEFYKYFPYVDKCESCLLEEGFSPGCPCTDADNYVYNSMFHTDLEWNEVGEKETFIEIEVKWTMNDYTKDIYENILLSFEKIN